MTEGPGGEAPELLASSTVACPYCGEGIDLLLDLSAGSQQYVEDCSVCCRPIVVAYTVEGGTLGSLEARTDSE